MGSEPLDPCNKDQHICQGAITCTSLRQEAFRYSNPAWVLTLQLPIQATYNVATNAICMLKNHSLE